MALPTVDRIEDRIPTSVFVTDLPPHEEPRAIGNPTAGNRLPVRSELISEFSRLEQLAQEWRRLWNCDPQGEIFQTPEWAIAWWRAFGRHNALCSVAVFAGDELVGLVPLVERDGVIHFLGTPEADYADIICTEEWALLVLAATFKTLSETVPGWNECILQHVSQDSRLMRHYRGLPQHLIGSSHCIPTERYQTITVRDKNDKSFNSLLAKHHTRRRRNKLQKAGEVRFRNFETQADAEANLPEFFRHHIRRFAATGRQSLCATPEFCQFLQSLVELLGPAEKVRFGVLELDGRPVSWHFGFEANGKFLLYQHTFDLDAADYTPGELMLWYLLAYARDHAVREFDFGTGEELYKNRFSNDSRQTYSIFIESRNLIGRMRGLARSLQSYIQPPLHQVKEVARSRATMRAFRSIRMWAMGTMAGIERAANKGVLWQYGRQFVRALFRNSIWRKQSIQVFAAEALRKAETKPGGDDTNDLACSSARFGDLVDLAWEHPDILLPGELPYCRKRLKKGDRAYITKDKSGVVMICWVSNSAAASVVCNAHGSAIAPDSPVILIEESWSARNGNRARVYRFLLSAMAGEAAGLKTGTPVYCGSDQPGLRSELERQGFSPRFQITRYRALGRLHRESVRMLPDGGLRSSRVA